MGALATKPACPYAFMRAAMAFAFVLALALISPAVAFAETYAHGHLRYEVADQSVTITGYAGHEEIVTVPSMIGGNPVNSIASGAFSTAASVETVYLPNTVVSVEQGAFAPSQAVVHGVRPSEEEGILGPSNPVAVATENTVSVDEATVGEEATDVEGDPTEPGTQPGTASGTQSGVQPGTAPGIRTNGGSIISVDSENHLVHLDASGTERVLDDSRTYTRETRADGTVAIFNNAGERVVVHDGSRAVFSDAEGREVSFDTSNGTTATTTANATGAEGGYDTYSHEEVDAEVAEGSKAEPARDQPNVQHGINPAVVVAIVVGVIVAAGAVYLFMKKKKKE